MAVADRHKTRFGEFEVDLHTGELIIGGTKVKLQPQPLQVLALLLEHPGELVTREELLHRVWPADTFVDFEQGLNTAIKKLRLALNDNAEKPIYIETLPRRGYRFIFPLASQAEEGIETYPKRKHQKRRIAVIAASGAAILVLLPTFLMLARLRAEAPRIRSIAVLPLQDISEDPRQYFADAMTDDLTTTLAKTGAIRVVSRRSAMAYGGKSEPVARIAKDLKVDAIIEGTVQRSGERVRVNAQLIYAPTDRTLWANSYDGDLRDVLSLQSALARAIAQQVNLKLTPAGKAASAKITSVNPEAYELYVKGRYQYANWQHPDKSAELFERAIEKDPNFAPAYADLAMSYSILGFFQNSHKTYAKARAAVEKALQLDPALAEGYAAAADINYRYEWDWTRAEENFRIALELNPVNAQFRDRYAMFLMVVRRFDEAIQQAKQAEMLDPASIEAKLTLATVYQKSRHYDEAIGYYKEVLSVNPNDGVALSQLPWVLAFAGDYEGALRNYKGSELDPDYFLAFVYGVTGRRDKALTVIKRMEVAQTSTYVSPFELAVAYVGIDEKTRAFELLNKAYSEHCQELMLLNVDPWLDPIRPDPRFQELLRRMKFPTS